MVTVGQAMVPIPRVVMVVGTEVMDPEAPAGVVKAQHPSFYAGVFLCLSDMAMCSSVLNCRNF